MSSHYELLGVRRDASTDELKKACERKVKALAGLPEPDRAVREKMLKDALAILTDPAKRTDYDSRLEEYSAPPEPASSGSPIIVGVVVVALTVFAIVFFVNERSKERAQMRMEQRRAAEKLEKDKRALPSPPEPAKRGAAKE